MSVSAVYECDLCSLRAETSSKNGPEGWWKASIERVVYRAAFTADDPLPYARNGVYCPTCGFSVLRSMSPQPLEEKQG